METKVCMVPLGIHENENGEVEYECCGRPADYKVGYWFVCEKHKTHYCDRYKWNAELLEVGYDEETIGC